MAPTIVDAVIAGEMKSVEALRPHASELVGWLKANLPLAHQDKELKRRIKSLLGAPLFSTKLAHFEVWDELIEEWMAKALILGGEMHDYFYSCNLGNALGTDE